MTMFIFCSMIDTFLSTLSLRRATSVLLNTQQRHIQISIHALLAESDIVMAGLLMFSLLFLSTLSLRRATPSITGHSSTQCISIHALLAESDTNRDIANSQSEISIHALLAESDLFQDHIFFRHSLFLSTLSLRRATRAL